ncbi:MAG TPA: Omp28-related outer membrane protein, partial [Bacteroidales bacterium]|nr:Omp28-related outer membrane protein [Bacteroidales bacterium]
QTLTTNQPLNKNVVLEEYTGIHCQYCPEGHAIAASILANHPGRSAAIAVHQGSYASPSTGEPDFRTPFGDPLAGQTGLSGYPSGTVNRHVFTGGVTALNRGDWTANSEIILQQPSPVNVGVETTCDTNTRQLTVHVELYYTANSAVSSNYINVALIQNHIIGPQTGGGMGNNYVHMDMLRYLITGQWGDEVTTTTSGTLVERTYNYTIPADYNNVPCVIRNCEVVVFVTESHQEILTGDKVPAIDGTNLYVGDFSSTDSLMKLGQPSVPVDFSLNVNSNISGSHPFRIKVLPNAPGGWSAAFDIAGQTGIADSTDVDLTKGTPTPLTLHVTPGDSAGFAAFTLEMTSVGNPNAPAKYITVNVISNVHTLLVNAAGDNNATLHQDAYINGLTAAGCTHLAVLKSNDFVRAKTAGILTEILNIFYNCAWTFPAFTDPEATACMAFVDNGKNLFVAGQDVGWDIMSGAAGNHGTVISKNLYTNYLKASYVGDGSSTNNKLVAEPADPVYGTTATSNVVDVYGGNMYPDQIAPVQDATATFYYNTTFTKTAAVKSTKGQAKVVYFGVGLEMVQSDAIRNDILTRTYNWFMEGMGTGENPCRTAGHLGSNYPNPAGNETTIMLNSIDRDMMIQVVDMTGRCLLSVPVSKGDTRVRISTSNLGSGLYLYRLTAGNQVLESRKMNVVK